mmetsp:Transcript_20321/g.47485  ORF Transcript_20321/g.47485 Transcript_20321/m.47485 type:complete len:339 (+) Transcript_20321:24-1040(+)|eukprot:CAMPEP_0114544616 /NCGR_PEP_ID=MMETSP0114-20121206/2969_1 /TAXON_ID=31324 /ORGANISM="Goniomonas sp, Strain m" /LENGTH=338 /DNA_ID=CAMNT_0001729003 /DNA_START=15 /DNA_END=1031 /DNA_ORIENTATION=+
MADESIFKLVQEGPRANHQVIHRVAVPQKGKDPHWGQMDQVAGILAPSNARDEMVRKGLQPKDHIRQYRDAVKQDSEINRLKKEIEAAGASEPKRSQKYAHVKSTIGTTLRTMSQGSLIQRDDDIQLDSPEIPGLSRRTENLHVDVDSKGRQAPKREPIAGRRASVGNTGARAAKTDRDRGPSKAAVPRATEARARPEASAKNFVLDNFQAAPAAYRPPPEKKVSKQDKHLASHVQGKVPDYLKDRKMEIEERKRREALAARPPDAPPGLRLLPNDERQETLAALNSKKAELEKQYSQLSMTSTTVSANQRRKGLDDQLREVEGAIAIFSKTKVFVAE